jgi:two-component system, NtrC family, response regulator AtoC
MHLQAKLLSVLEDGTMRRIGSTAVTPVNVRIIAATNADLESALGKTFRKDLYYRLSVVRIHIPPLREHPEDIPRLCSHLLSKTPAGRNIELSQSELERLRQYDWPGNIRELRNVLERALFLQKGQVLSPSLLLERYGTMSMCATKTAPLAANGLTTLEQAEHEAIRRAISALSGNLTRTSKALGISLSTLKRKLRASGGTYSLISGNDIRRKREQ